MVKLFYRDDSTADKASYAFLLAFLVFLPFDRFYSELMLIGFALHSFIHARKNSFKGLVSREILLLQSVYLLTIISTVYTSNKGQAFSDWMRQLAIFLIPLLFYITSIDLKKYRFPLLLAFAFTCTATIVWLYIDALRIIAYYNMPLSSLFTPFFINHNFSAPIGLHATFLSLYSALSLICVIHFLLKEKRTGLRLLYIFCAIVLTAGLVQSGSKSIFIAMLVILNFVMPFYYAERKKRLRFVLFTLCLSFVAVAMIYASHNFRERYVSGLKTDLVADTATLATADPRIVRWEAALSVIGRSPVIGHGSGDEVDLLKEEYYKERLYTSYLFHLNTHNQYLSFLVKSGVIGLLVFLYTLWFGFAAAVRTKNIFLMSFLVLVATVCFSENILDANKGIFFYAFFFSLFIVPEAKAKKMAGATAASSSAFLKNDAVIATT
jgi:O-antigen ligase